VTARHLSLAAYPLSSDRRAKNETSIRENLPPYAEIYTTLLAQQGGRAHAEDALRKQLHRDVEALAGAYINPGAYAARRAMVRFSPTVARWMEERPEVLEQREHGSADYALYYTDPAWAARRVMRVERRHSGEPDDRGRQRHLEEG